MGVPPIERDTAGYAGLTPAGRRFVQFAPQLVHGVPPSWCHAHRRTGDDRPALFTAIDLLTDFTDSITRSALS